MDRATTSEEVGPMAGGRSELQEKVKEEKEQNFPLMKKWQAFGCI